MITTYEKNNRGAWLAIALLVAAACLLLPCSRAFADAGVLIPTSGNETGNEQPNPKLLSLRDMRVEVLVNNQHSVTRVLQVYESHSQNLLEGKYVFQIPEDASISNFAIWENGVRIPGVIMEKKRAQDLYQDIVNQQIDPGLLHQADDAEDISAFVVKVAPIPAFGTKRIEIEYTQNLTLSSLSSYYSFPLKPSMYNSQSADKFTLNVQIKSNTPLQDFNVLSKSMPLRTGVDKPNLYEGAFQSENFNFTENFDFEYSLGVKGMLLDFLTYRKTDLSDEVVPVFIKEVRRTDHDGYFQANGIFNFEDKMENGEYEPINAVILLDTSLSMKWDKLERSYEALTFFLNSLSDDDSFSLVLFNDDVNILSDKLLPATGDNTAKALDFVKGSYLANGTDLLGALTAGLGIIEKNSSADDKRYVIVISDGRPTLGAIWKEVRSKVAEANTLKTPIFAFGIGGDTNVPLFEDIAKDSDGFFTWARETDSLEYRLRSFFETLNLKMVRGISLVIGDEPDVNRVYPVDEQKVFNGSSVNFVGRYSTPIKNVSVGITGVYNGENISKNIKADFPDQSTEYPHLKRLWAQARVDFLLKKIADEGENDEWIDEIIELSKQYNFVTPYTAFLAAPRALLRPRVIKPGDPVLRVRTDEAIVAVTAVFPFNLTKNLTYIPDEDVWETRFLAPVWMNDGTYTATLLLEDNAGNIYNEQKSFVIDSSPPGIKVAIDKGTFKPGTDVFIRVYADSDTRRISAQLLHLPPADIRWNPSELASTGLLHIPSTLPDGSYTVKVFAEDFAHNVSSREITLEVAQ